MRRSLYLHIGYPKTGTSAIQAAFYENRARLREQSLLYPRTAVPLPERGHHNLAHSLTSVASIPGHLYRPGLGAFEELREEIEAERCDRILVSSEAFNNVTRDAPRVFREVVAQHFGDLDVHIVVFLRRADEYLESMFLQRLWGWYADRHDQRTPALRPWIEHVRAHPGEHLHTVFNLMELPHDLIVRMPAADSVAEMAGIVGYEGALDSPGRRNRRLTLKQASLLYLLSSSDRAEEAKRAIRADPRGFKRLLEFSDDTRRYRLFDTGEAESLLANVRDSYEEIARRTGAELELHVPETDPKAELGREVFSSGELRAIEDFLGFRLG